MDKLPIEIIDIIIDFKVSLIHKKKFKNTFDRLPLKSILFKIDYIDKIYQTQINYDNDYLNLILNLTTYHDRINIIEILNTWKSCLAHQERRPSCNQFLNGYIPNYSIRNYHEKKCKCKCRSFCRSLCRAQNNELIINE